MSTNTPEYQALTSPTVSYELRRVFRYGILDLSLYMLVEKKVISWDDFELTYRHVPRGKRADMLIEILQKRVQENPEHYHTFVQVLQDASQLHGGYYDHTIYILQEEFRTLHVSLPETSAILRGANIWQRLGKTGILTK